MAFFRVKAATGTVVTSQRELPQAVLVDYPVLCVTQIPGSTAAYVLLGGYC